MGLAGNYAAMPAPAYKITKAAMNMLTIQYAHSFGKEGFTFFSISPGVCSPSFVSPVSNVPDLLFQWLQTDLGGSNADLPVQTGADAVLEKILSATPEQNGKFLNIRASGWENKPGLNQYDGKDAPW